MSKSQLIKKIKDKIGELEEFLECDMYSKFRPATTINNKTWYRKDAFINEEEFIEYLRGHFNILKKQLKRIVEREK